MWDQRDSYPACLRCSYPWWSPSSLISPFLPLHRPRPPPFLLCLPWPSICSPINRRLLISASFILHIFSQSSPNVLFNCICPIPSYSFSFSLLLYRFMSFLWSLFHSTVSAFSLSGLSRGVLTCVVMGCCQRSLLCQCRRLSAWPGSWSNVEKKPDSFVDIWDVIHLKYILIWTASVYHTETSAPAVRV